MEKRDYYDVLGISKNATDEEIKKAYRLLAKKYHPDVSTEKDAEAKFKEVQEAYDVLSDETKRAQYDQFGHQGMNGGFGGAGGFSGSGFEGFDFGDIFSAFFGGQSRTNQGGRTRARKGSDIQKRMSISFEESIFGKKEKIRIPVYEECHVCHGTGAQSQSDIHTCSKCHGTGTVIMETQTLFGRSQTRATCPVCHGTGKEIRNKCTNCNGEGVERVNKEIEVNVPSGIETGQQIRLEGFGNKGTNGGPSGDLYIVFEVTPSNVYTREGDDLIINIPITFTQAALGAEIEVPTPYGNVLLKIPAGTQSDAKFRIRGKGAPNVRTKAYGDEHVHVTVVTPSKLSAEQRKLFEQMAKIEDSPANKSAWSRFKSSFSRK
ncbi:MAG TPA: molecular chaperone DnaJ [Bacillota bacterium]|nr:molecular chaperone DnaJ [Bacillota bacterium]HPF42517.1 molecular chaperone DnaJ [Bacillota bacterium]HPJ85991.1 molecular chaperone DnaJ [Bacillota bacterium]HPQ61988.1 molecular chaperone DnaJ [Bacillota bacterium]HRX91858.1 molecular chaperone DnaJ [Candidatus Izemoplasmatales bacterium]